MKAFINKKDLLLIGILLLGAGLLFFAARSGTEKNLTAEVRVDGETIYTISLAALQQAETKTLTNGIVLTFAPDGAQIAAAPCRDQCCVSCGLLTKAGDTAVCLPQRTQLLLRGSTAGQLDALTY